MKHKVAPGHQSRRGDIGKVTNVKQLKEGLVCGELGKQMKEKKKIERKQMRAHNANVKKQVTVLNEIGKKILNGFSEGLEKTEEKGEIKESQKKKTNNKRGANDLLKKKTNKETRYKGTEKEEDKRPSIG